MPVYNCAEHLAEAIESILNQTYSNFELIIINDSSTDNSEQIIKSYDDRRIRYFENSENKGIVASLNSLLGKCKGNLIARMDGDDIAHAERIERQVQFFENNDDVGLISSWYVKEDSVNSRVKIIRKHTDDKHIKFHMMFRNQFLHPGIMMKANLLRKLRYHDVSTCEDYDLWARALKHCRVANVPVVLMKYRWHGKNVSLINNSAMRKSMAYIISNLLTEYGIEHSEQELLLQLMISLAFNKEQLTTLGKVDLMRSWLNKLTNSQSLNRRFGQQFVDEEIRTYKKMYDFE